VKPKGTPNRSPWTNIERLVVRCNPHLTEQQLSDKVFQTCGTKRSPTECGNFRRWLRVHKELPT
jgi:hypothetical protein